MRGPDAAGRVGAKGNGVPAMESAKRTEEPACGLAGLRPEVVFVDIDGTLTHAHPAAPRPAPPANPLVGLLGSRGLPLAEAERQAREAERAAAPKPGGVWPFGAAELLGLDAAALTAYVLTHFPARYEMSPDAVRFMNALRLLPGIRVYPATTNPSLFILGKLAAGGLADAAGTPVFDGCFGGEEVSPGGKCGPSFYQALCDRVGVTPDRCVMVGDEPTPDCDYARAAGIGRVFLVNRGASEPLWADASGAVVVNSLDRVWPMIRKACGR